jgi:predicted NBD/HSP70 family sugar kinase
MMASSSAPSSTGAPAATDRIGIDLGGTKISGVVLARDGGAPVKRRVASPRHDYGATLAALEALVTELEAAAGLAPGASPVGIGAPGSWVGRIGRMKNCNSTWLNDRPLLSDLEARLGPRVRLANDADCFALSEAVDGGAAGAASAFGVILGTGVGGGVVIRGELLAGPNGLAGEWGHVPLPYLRSRAFAIDGSSGDRSRFQLESRLEDRRCYCGRLNCIETFLSGPGLAVTHAELWGEKTSAEAVAEGAAGADERALATLDLYQHMLARSLAQVVNLIDPAVIVLGGGVSNVTELYPVQASLIPRYAFSSMRDVDDVRVVVTPARWGDDSGVRGAARLWG